MNVKQEDIHTIDHLISGKKLGCACHNTLGLIITDVDGLDCLKTLFVTEYW
jgi:hypothetical protein